MVFANNAILFFRRKCLPGIRETGFRVAISGPETSRLLSKAGLFICLSRAFFYPSWPKSFLNSSSFFRSVALTVGFCVARDLSMSL